MEISFNYHFGYNAFVRVLFVANVFFFSGRVTLMTTEIQQIFLGALFTVFMPLNSVLVIPLSSVV